MNEPETPAQREFGPAIGVGVVLILIVGAFAVKALFFGSMTVEGTMTINGSSNWHTNGSNYYCSGTGGYDDLESGASVVIRNSDGKQVGLGVLRGGESTESEDTCVFTFVVEDVDDGDELYSVEVTHRGEVTFRKDDAKSVALSIGD